MPLLGGPAMVIATIVVLYFLPGLPQTVWVLIAGALTLAAVGLWDDLRPIPPYTKLAAQLAAAGAVTAAGLRFPLTGMPIVDILITVVWLVGLSNAFNLLDNMDGLAAGVAAVAGTTKMVLFALDGYAPGALVSAAFVGACLGFLALNFNPARIFMGDAGSMFLGFFVAGLSTIGASPDSRATASVVIGPVAVMLVPIFDTVLVTAVRVIAGRPISQGGRDHLSHRLVIAGLSERRAVLTLYGLAAVAGAVAIITRNVTPAVAWTLFAALSVAMFVLGVGLSRIKVYQVESDAPRSAFRMPLPPPRAYMRQFAAGGIDAMLVLAAYSAAALFRASTRDVWTIAGVVELMPLVFSAKMLALAVFRAHNRIWRYTNSHDLLAMVRASTVGSALAFVAAATTSTLNSDIGAILALDWILATASLCTSRLALRGMAEFLQPAPTTAARVLIYGAGDAGVALLHEIRNNPAIGRHVVGFVDDDPMKQNTRIQGTPVLRADHLGRVVRELRADEVILATHKLDAARLEKCRTACDETGVKLSRFRLTIEGMPALAQVRQIR